MLCKDESKATESPNSFSRQSITPLFKRYITSSLFVCLFLLLSIDLFITINGIFNLLINSWEVLIYIIHFFWHLYGLVGYVQICAKLHLLTLRWNNTEWKIGIYTPNNTAHQQKKLAGNIASNDISELVAILETLGIHLSLSTVKQVRRPSCALCLSNQPLMKSNA